MTPPAMPPYLPDPDRPLRIGTRGSPLALAQAREARARLMTAHGLPEAAFEIVAIRTTGDRVLARPLAAFGGKGLFTREIEDALLAGAIDVAVHSMKDLPALQPDGLGVTCLLPREDVRDAFVSLGAATLADLPAGAVIGTSSPRRRAQLLNRRSDLAVVEFRGNVETRLRKLGEGLAAATLLAVAGLRRLGLDSIEHTPVPPEDMLPAIGQGAIGIEQRLGDDAVAGLLAPVHDPRTGVRLAAERALLAGLDGSCRTPIAGLAELKDGTLWLRGEILRPDGTGRLAHEVVGAAADAKALGGEVAAVLRTRAGPGFFAG